MYFSDFISLFIITNRIVIITFTSVWELSETWGISWWATRTESLLWKECATIESKWALKQNDVVKSPGGIYALALNDVWIWGKEFSSLVASLSPDCLFYAENACLVMIVAVACSSRNRDDEKEMDTKRFEKRVNHSKRVMILASKVKSCFNTQDIIIVVACLSQPFKVSFTTEVSEHWRRENQKVETSRKLSSKQLTRRLSIEVVVAVL